MHPVIKKTMKLYKHFLIQKHSNNKKIISNKYYKSNKYNELLLKISKDSLGI